MKRNLSRVIRHANESSRTADIAAQSEIFLREYPHATWEEIYRDAMSIVLEQNQFPDQPQQRAALNPWELALFVKEVAFCLPEDHHIPGERIAAERPLQRLRYEKDDEEDDEDEDDYNDEDEVEDNDEDEDQEEDEDEEDDDQEEDSIVLQDDHVFV